MSSRYFISTLDAWVPKSISTVAFVGDSITDGRGSDDNMNNRWPDLLLARLQASRDPPSPRSRSPTKPRAGTASSPTGWVRTRSAASIATSSPNQG